MGRILLHCLFWVIPYFATISVELIRAGPTFLMLCWKQFPSQELFFASFYFFSPHWFSFHMHCMKRGAEEGAVKLHKAAWYQLRGRAPLSLTVTQSSSSEGTQSRGSTQLPWVSPSSLQLMVPRMLPEMELMCFWYPCGKCFRRNKKNKLKNN